VEVGKRVKAPLGLLSKRIKPIGHHAAASDKQAIEKFNDKR